MDVSARQRTDFVLSEEVLSTATMPDTEEVTGSIPESPTSSKTAPDLRKRRPGAAILESFKRPWCPLIDKLRDK